MSELHKVIMLLLLPGVLMVSNCKKETNTDIWVNKSITIAKKQLQQASAIYQPGNHPRSIWPDGEIRYAPVKDWTAGFFPGSLWLMYEITEDEYFRKQAEIFTQPLDTIQYFTHTHDLGFILNSSFGNGYRLTGNEKYKDILVNGTKTLSSRFSKTVGCIKSWDFDEYSYPVIIDNMMNLEMLMWTFKVSGNELYKQIAISHANITLANHFRNDNSSIHVIDYNPETGEVARKITHQGYADSSAWARGQAWGLYGYTMMYRETKKEEYHHQAIKIAEFIINHPRLPEDKIPYWDFDAPKIKHTYRDVSAATIMASALLELSTFDKGDKYFLHAEEILKNLSDDRYLAEPGENGYFILKHSVGNLPNYSEIDTPINYADYYYLESLIRYAKITGMDL